MDSFNTIQVRVLNSFFEALNFQAVSYCILRNYDDVPHDIGNDLDVLVDEQKVFLVESILIGEMRRKGFILSNSKRRLGYVGLYFHHPKFQKAIAVDLITRCVKLWYEYVDVAYILEKRIAYKNFYVPVLGAVLYTVVFKDILTYGTIRHKNLKLIRQIQASDYTVFERCGGEYFTRSTYRTLFDKCIKEEFIFNRWTLFAQLQLKVSIKNVLQYLNLRIKDMRCL